MNFGNIEEKIIENELKLLDTNIRNNKVELKKLLSEKFIEYGSSGSIYTYNETINSLSNVDNEIKFKMIKIETKRLSENIILVLYTIEIDNIVSNRSSIWQKENDEWKIIFHQGTKTKI